MNFTLFNMKLNPTRTRLIQLKPGSTIDKHTDAVTKNQYAFRVHIPILTNPECVFWIKDDREYHLEPGYLFLFNVNSCHAVFNRGETSRWHIVSDVYDEGNNFSIGHCVNYDYHKRIADTWRRYVDGEINEPKRLIINE